MFPLTYTECRARFLRAAAGAEGAIESHALEARGRDGETVRIDVARLGEHPAARTLVVLSGTHGIEGFAGSSIQTQLLGDLASGAVVLPPRTAIVLVHAVNPWGMSWWRRQNESNVDLNRNWMDFSQPLPGNEGYVELHPWLCPASLESPSEAEFVEASVGYIEERGLPWVRNAVSVGQYQIADGLYFGGHRREASTAALAHVIDRHVTGTEEALTIDLHTGLGPFGDYTLLSNAAAGTPEQDFVERCFDPDHVEITRDNPDAATPDKRGQLARGFAELLPDTRYRSVTLEIGTLDDLPMILAERAEHWLHRHGERNSEAGRAIEWRHRIASIPDSREWEASALHHGRRVLGDACAGLFD